VPGAADEPGLALHSSLTDSATLAFNVNNTVTGSPTKMASKILDLDIDPPSPLPSSHAGAAMVSAVAPQSAATLTIQRSLAELNRSPIGFLDKNIVCE
jgi:hypothetical protein